jgi:protein-S-isoprenylcysteine O-methyltransferase Ste14
MQKSWLVRTGDFFFKWRNYLFPVIVLSLFVSFRSPGSYLGQVWIEEAKDCAALALIFAGLGFRFATIGWAYIKRGGMNKEVYANTLVRSGFFGLCRNPLYVGNLLVYAGIFIMHGHQAVIIIGIALYAFIYVAIVAAEEFYLRGKFGEEYAQYCVEVPRWIPRFKNYKTSVEGMQFKIRRCIYKDYTTIFNAMTAVLLIEVLEHLTFRPASFETTLIIAASLFAASTVMLGIVKYIKKTSDVKI